MVLETTFQTSTGTVAITDALVFATGDARPRHREALAARAGSPAQGVDGEVELDVEFAPRTEYGLVHPLLKSVDGGISARGGGDWLMLSSPVPFEIDGPTARARFLVRAGDTVGFALHHRTTSDGPP